MPTESNLSVEINAVYAELKRMAASQLRKERSDHTLSATGLVNEAYLKLSSAAEQWQDKNHFMWVAARAMRQILVSHAVARLAEKRGGDWIKLSLTASSADLDAQILQQQDAERAVDVVGLDEALAALEKVDPRQGRIVELRYFAGLTIEATAQVMDLSPATVKREWALARLFLKRMLQQ